MASYLFTFVTTPVPCIAVKTVGRIILDDFGDGFVFVEEFSPLEAILVTASADRIIDQVLASLAFAVTTERPLTLAHAIDLLVGQPAAAVTRALALATLRLCRGDRGRASQILQLGENDLLDLLQDGDAYSREMRGSL
ncbi:hypothetical protein OE766_14905 [Pararhizobium sp. YC-54]|uniref:hypothetical protein n=1 Tax=Pararhizobium sp. YC-54 TaxID=2986920 RepID=UPI0021F7A6BC|nr:hypothetical protein [Pararhizobium sp. YC-54]MCV9999531.1 hypothetical protein [Pararhizobium sp. YC-54]